MSDKAQYNLFQSLLLITSYAVLMRSIILAAGRGSRLGDLTSNRPKLFIEIFGETIYERQIAVLENYCDEVIVVLGHGFEDATDDEIRSILQPHRYEVDIDWLVIDDWESVDNAASLTQALSAIVDSQHSLIINGDIIFKNDVVEHVIEVFTDECVSAEFNLMACTEGLQNEQTAIVHDENDVVTDYGKINGHRYTGISVLHEEHAERARSILEKNSSEWYPICFPKVPTKSVYINEHGYQEINTPEHLVETEQWIKNSTSINE